MTSDLSQDVASSIKSVKQGSADIQQFLQALFKTADEGNAQMAAMHEQALSLSTNNIQARFEVLHEMAEKNQASASDMAGLMVGVFAPLDLSVSDREQQDLMTRIEVTSEHTDTMYKVRYPREIKVDQINICVENAADVSHPHQCN